MPDPDSSSKQPNELFGLDPGELLARGLNTAIPSSGSGRWVPPEPEELARLLPQYEIEKLIGCGGMGAVYKGRQPGLDRAVAIKLLPTELTSDGQFVLRFQREARTLARLQNPGIVSVYDSGQTSGGHLYFVMEFVEGTDLRQILKTSQLTPDQALELICQICEALQAAHKQGVVHRDIKPENILISNEGDVKLADFGLARPMNEDSAVLTVTNTVMGTEDYMSPEQRRGDVDERTDIFALGIVLYEMLTGRPPRGAFDLPSRKVQVDVRIDEIVLKALQEEPDRRYQQVSELKTEVDRVRSTPPQTVAPAGEKEQSGEASAKQQRSHLALYLVAGSLAAVVVIGLLVWAFSRHPQKGGTATAGPGASSAGNSSSSTSVDLTLVTDPAHWTNAVNLLPLVNLNRDIVRGVWYSQQNGLASGPQGAACLEIPYTPPEEYDYRITFTRLTGSEGIHQILSKSGRSFEWFMGANNSSKIGFMQINGLGISNPTTVVKPGCIVNGRQYTSIVSVRNNGVAAYLDGELVDQLKTDYHEMGPYPAFTLRNADRLGIGSFSASTVFHSIEVIDVTGKGTVIQTGSPAAAATPAPAPLPAVSGQTFVSPDSLQIQFSPEKSMKLFPVGTQRGGSTMTTDNPVDVFRGQPVIFDQHTGNEVHFTVDSPAPVYSLQYTGVAFQRFTIRIYDRNAMLVASCGPYGYGDKKKTLEVPLPGLTHCEVVIENYSPNWLLINSIRFSGAPGAGQVQSMTPVYGASSSQVQSGAAISSVTSQATPALTVEYLSGEGLMKPYPVGYKRNDAGGNVQTTLDATRVFYGTPVFFDQHTGQEVIFNVTSSVPIRRIVYTGMAYDKWVMEAIDFSGRSLASTGQPMGGGNHQYTVGMDIPGGATNFKLVVKNRIRDWLLIQAIRFEVADGVALKPDAVTPPIPNNQVAVNPSVVMTPTASADKAAPADLTAWVLEKKQRWPNNLKLTQPVSFPILVNGAAKGAITAPVGTTVRVLGLRTGQVSVEWTGNRMDVPFEATDLMKRAAELRKKSESTPIAPAASGNQDDKLKNLKQFYDQGLITKEVYESKLRDLQGIAPNPRLQKLKELFDQGLINKETYDKKAAEISQGR